MVSKWLPDSKENWELNLVIFSTSMLEIYYILAQYYIFAPKLDRERINKTFY